MNDPDRSAPPTEKATVPPGQGEASEPPPRRRATHFTPDRISAYAAVAGVVIAAVGVWVGTRDSSDPPSTSSQQTAADTRGRLGPTVVAPEGDSLAASGSYQDLQRGETVVFMVQPAQDDERTDPWITLFAEREPTSTVEGLESGRWSTRLPVDVSRPWRHVVSIGPEVVQGVGDSDVLSQLAEQGPDSPLLRDVTDVQVYQPEPP